MPTPWLSRIPDHEISISPSWSSGAGRSGGGFWFFQPDNVELVVKVLDARAVNGRFWVLYGSLTDVELTLRVHHPKTGDEVIFENPSFYFGSGADTTSLAPPDGVRNHDRGG